MSVYQVRALTKTGKIDSNVVIFLLAAYVAAVITMFMAASALRSNSLADKAGRLYSNLDFGLLRLIGFLFKQVCGNADYLC